MAGNESLIELFFFCVEDDFLGSVIISRNASSLDLTQAVAKKDPNWGTIWLVPPGCISFEQVDQGPSAVRSALRGRFEGGTESLKKLSRHNYKIWLETIREEDEDLHLVLRHHDYPYISMYDKGTREVVNCESVHSMTSIEEILPPKKDNYDVYLFPEGTQRYPPGPLEQAINSHPIDTLQKVDPSISLERLAPWGFARGELHFVIVPPEGFAEFNIIRRAYFDRTPAKAPSSEAQASEFCIVQKSEVHRIYCGRPHHHSTPPSLLDKTLCRLRCDIHSITPTPKDMQCFESLRSTSCQNFESDDARREALTDVLTENGILPERAKRGFIGSSRFHDDGDLRALCLNIELIFYLQEIKREIGTTKAEPFVEAIHYWIENVRHFIESKSAKHAGAEKLNFPAILLLNFGSYLAIAAAVYGKDPIVEHLCCIPLHVHTTNESELAAGERALAALRVALQSLQHRYPNLPLERGPRADFPFRDFYEDRSGTLHHFTYVESIDQKRIFRVLENGTPLCVKFSKRYSSEAHEAAHAAGFAPALHAVNSVCDWIMIVMDDKSADYSNTMWDIKHEKKKGRAKPKTDPAARSLPKSAVTLEAGKEQVTARLKRLHERGFVHGDVRDINVLVRNENAGAGSPDILIVDWDWAGRLGEVRYPRGINTQLARPPDALAGEEIKAGHDMWMAERLAN